jgi:hypothetical protein
MAIGNWIGEKTAKFFGYDRVTADILGTIEEERSIQSRVLAGIDGLREKVETRNIQMAIMRDRIARAVALLGEVADEVEDKPEDYRNLPDPTRIRELIVLLVGAAGLSPADVSKAIVDFKVEREVVE